MIRTSSGQDDFNPLLGSAKVGCPEIGYFPQNVGEMSGRSALLEVMSGASDVMKLGKKMKKMAVVRRLVLYPADKSRPKACKLFFYLLQLSRFAYEWIGVTWKLPGLNRFVHYNEFD